MHLKYFDINHNNRFFLFIKPFIIFLLSLVLSKYIIARYFPKNTLLFHSIAEITCLTLSLAIFFLIWFTYEQNSTENHILGFGFLAISLFKFMHILTFSTSSDYSLWYMLLERMLEVGIIFLIISKTIKVSNIKKGTGFLITIAFSTILWFLVWINRHNLPILYNISSYLSLRLIVEIILIALILTCFFLLTRKSKNEFIIYELLYQSLVLMSFTSLCFIIMGKSPTSYFNIMAHFIRVGYYILLFVGIFGRAVIYPYEKLEDILNHLPLAVVTYDSEYRLTFANRKAEEIIGTSLTNWYTQSDHEINDNLYINSENHYIRRISKETKEFKNEIHTIKANSGELIKVVVNAYRLESGGYQTIFYEAKKAQALENMLLQTQTILNSINNFIVILDNNQRIIMCNKSVEETVGKKTGDLVGLNILEFIKVTRISDETIASKALSGETNSKFPIEINIISGDGSIKDLFLQIDTIMNIDGEIIGSIGVGTDITDLNREKEEQQQKEKLALLGHMAVGIVHEIRNPLTAIKGFSSLIKSKPQSEKIPEFATYIEEEVNGLNKIVTDYLTFAKPNPVMLKEVFPNDFIQSLKPILDSHALLKGINISYHFGEDIIAIDADEGQIKQVILNIVKNAIDELNGVDNAEIKIGICYNNLLNETSISIYNNGRALTNEEKKKIGTPFFTTKAQGTGLGLSICHQIMKDHSGRIDVKSEQGFGTVFELFFPAIKAISSIH